MTTHTPVIPMKLSQIEIPIQGMTFGEATSVTTQGEKVTRIEWANPEIYLFIQAEILHINNDTGKHVLQVNIGDILGTDYYIVE